jgi:hypothetical protein
VRIEDDGRIVLGGATLASGYRNPPDPDPFAEPGWFRTDDVGALDDSGSLQVLKADDAISTGGLTVLPQPVESAPGTHPAIADCAVFGAADDRLGQRVVAAVVLRPGAAKPGLDELRTLSRHAGAHRRTASSTSSRKCPPRHRQDRPAGAAGAIRALDPPATASGPHGHQHDVDRADQDAQQRPGPPQVQTDGGADGSSQSCWRPTASGMRRRVYSARITITPTTGAAVAARLTIRNSSDPA